MVDAAGDSDDEADFTKMDLVRLFNILYLDSICIGIHIYMYVYVLVYIMVDLFIDVKRLPEKLGSEFLVSTISIVNDCLKRHTIANCVIQSTRYLIDDVSD